MIKVDVPEIGTRVRRQQVFGNADAIVEVVMPETDQHVSSAAVKQRHVAQAAARCPAGTTRFARFARLARAEIVAQQRAGRLEEALDLDFDRARDQARICDQFAPLSVEEDVEKRPSQDGIAVGVLTESVRPLAERQVVDLEAPGVALSNHMPIVVRTPERMSFPTVSLPKSTLVFGLLKTPASSGAVPWGLVVTKGGNRVPLVHHIK